MQPVVDFVDEDGVVLAFLAGVDDRYFNPVTVDFTDHLDGAARRSEPVLDCVVDQFVDDGLDAEGVALAVALDADDAGKKGANFGDQAEQGRDFDLEGVARILVFPMVFAHRGADAREELENFFGAHEAELGPVFGVEADQVKTAAALGNALFAAHELAQNRAGNEGDVAHVGDDELVARGLRGFETLGNGLDAFGVEAAGKPEDGERVMKTAFFLGDLKWAHASLLLS